MPTPSTPAPSETALSGAVEVTVRSGPDAERAAAGIWARATARRDELPVVAPTEDKLAGIRQSLGRDAASLHLASQGSRTCGFALAVAQDDILEIVYLATDPDVWGRGVGRALLGHVEAHALAAGCSALELWVIADNARAVRTYEGAGWTDTGDLAVRNASGRPERRYERPTAPLRTSSPTAPATRSTRPGTGSSR